MKDCRFRVVLLRGILNLSLLSMCLLSNSGLSVCVCVWGGGGGEGGSRQPECSLIYD